MTDLLEIVNETDIADCVAMLEGLVELSPWVVRRAMAARPFASPVAVADTLARAIRNAPREDQLTLIRAHPDLAGQAARAGSMTEESNSEQARLGLLNLPAWDLDRLEALNTAYRARFGMPFILALYRLPDLAAVLAIFEARLGNSPETEHDNALEEITLVVRNRTLNFFAAGPDHSAPASASPSPSGA